MTALKEAQSWPLFGPAKEQESAGSQIRHSLLPEDQAEDIFERLKSEVNWQKMHHQTGEVPRLVCCQGTIDPDGSMPVYRHPSDHIIAVSVWTSTVDIIRQAAEQVVGHPLNHALIQLYRGGNDYISEHSDKTLDVVPDSFIVNVSFGAQRTMRLRTKRATRKSPLSPSPDCSSSSTSSLPPTSLLSSPEKDPKDLPTRTTYRVPMPHNSILTMSLRTNAEYLHGINADKRPACELTEAEKSFDGQRISLTFRHIGTFLNADSSRIWGQGALAKIKDVARPVINGNPEESEKLVRAFGAENQASSIEWDSIYGIGFDVLNLK